MTQCTCECRGFCPVLNVAITEQMRQICIRDQAKAIKIAESLKMAREQNKHNVNALHKEQRRKRVEEAAQRKKRLIAWIKLLRSVEDTGVGDTTKRLLEQKAKHLPRVASDARDALSCLLKQCSCRRTDAVKRLNDQYPY